MMCAQSHSLKLPLAVSPATILAPAIPALAVLALATTLTPTAPALAVTLATIPTPTTLAVALPTTPTPIVLVMAVALAARELSWLCHQE